MSLFDKLLGRPTTLGEFISKCQKQGLKDVQICYESYDDDNMFGLPNYHAMVFIEAGEMKLKLAEFVHARSGDLYTTVVGKAKAEREAVKEALETYKRLLASGFNVTFRGTSFSVEFVEKEINDYTVSIQETCRKYGVTESLASVARA
ncbi:MAG: hypothetical protein HYW89_01300 [Candidatus Sungiibacteriota bacterium]|uniref:Uncharacterized protein n=1 Tax=Candidatus Sungiibacteriota bacterium TaxID=2750080 RepID=A0A7T5RJZ0_9BACT|nr:MAG: hypothetical protein HYW89_01300 [Candidatus Sungbacteria bacterium]